MTTTLYKPNRPSLAYDGPAGDGNVVDSSSHARLPAEESRVVALAFLTDLLASCSVVFTDVAIRTGYDDLPGTARGTLTVTAQTPTRQPLASNISSSQTCMTVPPAVTESNPMREDSNWVHASHISEAMVASGPASVLVTVAWAAESASVAPASTNARFLAQPPGIRFGGTQAPLRQGEG